MSGVYVCMLKKCYHRMKLMTSVHSTHKLRSHRTSYLTIFTLFALRRLPTYCIAVFKDLFYYN